MKKAALAFLMVLLLACSEDEADFKTIEGKWRGDVAEVQVKPWGIPIPVSKKDEDFSNEIEFAGDGTMTVWHDGKATHGTYQVSGSKLIADIDYSNELLELSGEWTIETLSDTRLVFYKKKNDTYTDPDSGRSVTGDFKFTLSFYRL